MKEDMCHQEPAVRPTGALDPPEVDGRGVPAALHSACAEVSERLRETIVQLADSQSLLAAVLDNTNNGIVLVGPDRTLLYANRRMGELFGVDLRGAIGHNQGGVIAEQIMQRVADPEAFRQRLLHLYEHLDETAVDEVEVVRPVRRTLERYSAPVYKEEGGLLGRIEVYSDVTEVRDLQRNKDEFLSLVSHELKTPVTSIKGYAQLLQRRARREQLPEQTRTAYQVIERQAARMQELIDTLLDLTRLETGRLVLRTKVMVLNDLVERAVQSARSTTDHHQFELHLPSQEVSVQGDGPRLEQVLASLLTNAVGYSPDGGIIAVRLEQTDTVARLSVSDQGAGIPPDALPRVFERFFRGADGPEQSGMGIGLYIARGIVEHHGGSISVESKLGQGSTFTVTLPLVRLRA